MLINCIKFDYINNVFTLFVSTKTYFTFTLLTILTHTAFISAIIVVVVTAKVGQALTAIDKQKSYFVGKLCVTFTSSLKYICKWNISHILSCCTYVPQIWTVVKLVRKSTCIDTYIQIRRLIFLSMETLLNLFTTIWKY